MENKKNGVLKLLFAFVLMAFLLYTAGFGLGSDKSGSLETIKQGLDLAGGVSITYEATKEPTTQEMDDTIKRLQKKADTYSTEAEVYQEGTKRINIDIPGVSDANKILEELGQLGQLYFKDSNDKTWLTGDDIKDAQAATDKNQTTGEREYYVALTLTEEGSKKFAEATEANVGKIIYIYYDAELISYPKVNQKISSTTCQITGLDDWDEASTLAENIRNGALPLELKEVRSNVVGARLGSDAIRTSLIAGLIGLILVIIFMIAYYRIPGVAAGISLIIYTGLMIMVLSSFQITMTLSGIAGIVLSVGMAVDANVIIFARIKEEIGQGKTVASAIKMGFSKALSAIVDGNITTMIAALVLFFMCSGTIKGFAITLGIGIVLSMVTALFVCKLILTGFYAIGIRNPKFYGKTSDREPINFLGKKMICFIVSGALICAGLIGMGVNALNGSAFNYALEFSGGTATSVTMPNAMTIEEIETEIVPLVKEATGVSSVQATTVTGSTEIIIKTSSLEDITKREALTKALIDKYGVTEKDVQTENISATIGSEMRTSALKAVIVAAILILLYVWIRFKDLRFGASAVAALIHDVLIVIGCYALFRWSVGNTFIACILTIVGYSINATIVIFDRVRENLAEKRDKDTLEYVVNKSITQSFSRSVNTSLTTLIMVVVLYIIGVTSIKEFAIPLVIGIVTGTYSSVCVTGALWFIMRKYIGKKA